ncbi:MAG: flagellar basal body rod protein FlgC [Candidatus Gastranaerophilales bacterium]|nr:flagellar basal body rod protein FlgC [Candidatus Gastranaerophilales bacterium]
MGILDSINVGASALKAQGLRLDTHAKNMANVDTPNYVRKIPILNDANDLSFSSVMGEMQTGMFTSSGVTYLKGGVTFTGVVEDPNLGEKLYKPGHPDADKDGYVRASNVNPMVEMADAMLAQRAYEANLALINITRSMAMKAVEIGK